MTDQPQKNPHRWITNLESEPSMAAATTAALKAWQRDPTPANKAALATARYRQADVSRTMRQIEMETGGRFTVGEPLETAQRTSAQIAADGIVGLYREGAGSAPMGLKVPVAQKAQSAPVSG